MCVGPGRIVEAMVTLKFDYNISPQIDKTIIISPYSKEEFVMMFAEFNINGTNFEILPEDYFDQYYDLSAWKVENWYKQQAFKLCALDHFDSDYFLLQDCDVIILQAYNIIVSGNLNFKGEKLWCPQAKVYGDAVEGLIGLKRTDQCSWVNEILPYCKQDWESLKEFIEQKYNKKWLDAISEFKTFDETRWFSEYELLGIYKTNQPSGWRHFVTPAQPIISTWEDCYSTDWEKHHAIKFHVPPLKFMNDFEAIRLVNFFKNDTDN